MIRLRRPPIEEAIPDAAVRAALDARVQEAALLAANDGRITGRWDSFSGGRVQKDLDAGPLLCAAVRAFCRNKCAYCEMPEPATIDHRWPKTDYPARMFDWSNLLAACRDCNSVKGSGFPLDAAGNPVQVDPVDDEPLTHFRWSHVTGECVCNPNDPRAAETHRAFRLDRLKGERLQKLKNLRTFFALVLVPGVEGRVLPRIRDELDATRPYLCAVRSYLLYPPEKERPLLRAAVRAAPQIVEWVRPWLEPPAGAAWPPS